MKCFLKSGLGNILFQILFLGLFFLIGRKLTLNFQYAPNIVILAGIILVPSIIWSIFYYLQDRRAPEPLPYLSFAFVAGMTACGFIALPLWQFVFHIDSWLYASTTLFLTGNFLVLSSTYSGLLYIILRYIFFPSREFDEPVDGMVYGAITGAGFALVKSLHSLSIHPDSTLFVHSYTASTHILIYSGIGSFIGFILARARFGRKNIEIYSLGAIVSGAALLAIYHGLNELIFISGSKNAFWISFTLTVIYSFVLTLFCYHQMARMTRKVYRGTVPRVKKIDSLVSVVLVVLLGIALVVSQIGMLGKKYENKIFGFSLHYPHSLTPFIYTHTSPLAFTAEGDQKTLFLLERQDTPDYQVAIRVYFQETDLATDDLVHFIDHADPQNLMISDIEIGGVRGKRIAYNFVSQPGESMGFTPKLIKKFIDIVQRSKLIYTFSFQSGEDNFASEFRRYRKILKSVRWLNPRV
jgi:RsiW-degrading membrane proteinase PrsW (M82 family)